MSIAILCFPLPWFIPRHWNLDDKFLTDEEELLRTLDTIDSAEKTDVIADPDSDSLFPPDSSYHHRQAKRERIRSPTEPCETRKRLRDAGG